MSIEKSSMILSPESNLFKGGLVKNPETGLWMKKAEIVDEEGRADEGKSSKYPSFFDDQPS